MSVIDCVSLSQKMREDIKKKVIEYSNGRRRPKLVVIKVGNDPASEVYVRNKQKACSEVGFQTSTLSMAETVTTEEVVFAIKRFNSNLSVDGILVQLPLPKNIDEGKVINAISPMKDVDGFTCVNVANLWQNKPCLEPCTPKGIIAILDSIRFKYEGSNAVVLGRSNIVGKPVAKMLMDRGCTVTICHSKTKDLKDKTKNADLVVSAMGKPQFLTKSHFARRGQVIVDVGINRDEEGKLCGDVSRSMYDVFGTVVTPVPKGVGVMTVTMLLQNTLELYEEHMHIK